jgi:ABC-type dipeptide/oligopeptide/nickel transport system permease subunit
MTTSFSTVILGFGFNMLGDARDLLDPRLKGG